MSGPSREQLRSYASDPLMFFHDLRIPAQGPQGGAVPFGPIMATHQLRDFQALAPTLLALKDDRLPPVQNFWIERTKGGGKDSDLAACIVWLLIFTSRALLVQICAADSDQASVVRDRIKGLLRANQWIAEIISVVNWRVSNERSEARCDIIATDAAGAPGPMPDLLVINELSEIRNQEFVDNVEENAAKSTRGVLIIATNSGHVGTWQHKRKLAVENDPQWYYSALREPAPWSDPQKIEQRRKLTSPNRFARLWFGVWTSASGTAIEPDDIKASLRHDGPMIGNEDGWSFVGGLDGAVKRDFAAVVVIGKNRNLRLRLGFVQVWRPVAGRIDQEQIENSLYELSKRFRSMTIGYDPARIEYLCERLRKRGVRTAEIIQSPSNLKDMASALVEAFTSASLELFEHPQLMHDLSAVELVEMSYGTRLKSPRESGQGHGDVASALAMALLKARELKPVLRRLNAW